MDRERHWQNIYQTKSPLEVSWYAAHLADSMQWIEEAAQGAEWDSFAIVDVGGGASTLVDDLWARGFHTLAVLDLSAAALALAQTRMGRASTGVQWIAGDVTQSVLPEAFFALWHDRAVFHFLTEAEDRAAYVAQARRALKPEGQLIVATFSMNGPERCSGLPVCRYDAESLAREFSAEFQLEKSATAVHRTPGGGIQEFLFCRLKRNAK